jgi:hypothetical protein
VSVESVDSNYLEIAKTVLARDQFATVLESTADGRPVLLAENAYFVLAVVSATNFKDLANREAYAADLLTKRVATSSAAGKRWDAYIVLMATEAEGDASTFSELVKMNYNTSNLRRIARVGVDASDAGVRGVLRPFLPLATPASDAASADPLGALEAQLPQFGVDKLFAARVIAAYRETGGVGDV